MRRETSRLINDILETEAWNQGSLAQAVGVTQPAVARWVSGQSTPRPSHWSKLCSIHAEARAHRWASNRFVPICAFAASYPPELGDLATEALDEMLEFAPLSALLKVSADSFSVDLHIRPAKLPKTVSAYTLANDRHTPSVFVVLVRKELSLIEQRRIAWEEVYAHVAQYQFQYDSDDEDRDTRGVISPHPRRSSRSLGVSASIVQHYRPEETR